jgi:hypothetical protein
VQSEKYATLTQPAEIAELMQAIHTYGGDTSTVYCLRIRPHVFTRRGPWYCLTSFCYRRHLPVRSWPGCNRQKRNVSLPPKAAGSARAVCITFMPMDTSAGDGAT